jgi:hypothetical protein
MVVINLQMDQVPVERKYFRMRVRETIRLLLVSVAMRENKASADLNRTYSVKAENLRGHLLSTGQKGKRRRTVAESN